MSIDDYRKRGLSFWRLFVIGIVTMTICQISVYVAIEVVWDLFFRSSPAIRTWESYTRFDFFERLIFAVGAFINILYIHFAAWFLVEPRLDRRTFSQCIGFAGAFSLGCSVFWIPGGEPKAFVILTPLTFIPAALAILVMRIDAIAQERRIRDQKPDSG